LSKYVHSQQGFELKRVRELEANDFIEDERKAGRIANLAIGHQADPEEKAIGLPFSLRRTNRPLAAAAQSKCVRHIPGYAARCRTGVNECCTLKAG